MKSSVELDSGVVRRRLVGVVDIGSNTVRLVVFDGHRRTPVAVFNEKATCALGADLETTGKLRPEGVALALAAVERFSVLTRAMGVERLDVVATAACRDASDAAAFVAEVERRCQVKVMVLSGEEEAMRSAFGVMCAVPDADGLVCDLGGGSLEIMEVSGGKTGRSVSLPFGVLRLAKAGRLSKTSSFLDARFEGISFLSEGKGRELYAVGGSWRMLARGMIERTGYPLHVLDNFRVPYAQALAMASAMARHSGRTLEKMITVSRRRLPFLPVAAQVLECLLRKIRPSAVVFSVYGMREGQYFLSMPEELRHGDPLLSAATDLARSAGRFPEHARELMDWMSPLFSKEPSNLRRLRHATCLLGDIFWNEHPDYRAEQAFLRILRLPFMGLSHRDRAALALAVFYRYAPEATSPLVQTACSLLSERRIKRLRLIGMALRLGHSLSGGVPGILLKTRLYPEDRFLVLELPLDDPVFLADLFIRRLDQLSAKMGLRSRIIFVKPSSCHEEGVVLS